MTQSSSKRAKEEPHVLVGRKSPFAPSDTHPLFAHLFPALGHDEEVNKYSAAEGKPADIVTKTFASLSFQITGGRKLRLATPVAQPVWQFSPSDVDPKLMIAITDSGYLKWLMATF